MGVSSGTVTFLFSDIEGSTRLWEEHPEVMPKLLARHDAILREAVESGEGRIVKTTGDGVFAVFERADVAVAAALYAQRALGAADWGAMGPLRVRMGLHTGDAESREGDYHGSPVNRAARLTSAGHGGQVLVSGATAALVTGRLPQGAELVALGEHRLRDLGRPEVLYQLAHPDLPARFPPLRTLDTFPGNLPSQLSSFIGRQREVDRALAALGDARVVTLTGVGGVGKTRLALHVAAEAAARFRDGAWLCELAPVRDPGGIADAIAAMFDLSPRGGLTVEQALVELLRTKELLLVLDNCEHLVAPVAGLVEMLGRSCPRLTVLATSREGLGAEGERILAVPPLAAPVESANVEAVASSEAVRLFVDRAQAVKSEFVLVPANAAVIAQLCRLLDGVPLAIELAAARIPAMNPAELVRRLDRRFEVLAGGRRGAVERHQTLRAAIDWSYDLLDEPLRRLLARLSVFAGGCTLEATEAVCGGDAVEERAVWELLATLVARSLLVAEDRGPDTRYRLLETIRQYAEERLGDYGETAWLRRRHREYYAGLAPSLWERAVGPDQDEWLDRFAAEQDNLVRAMHSALDSGDVDVAVRLYCGLPPAGVQAGGLGFRFAAGPVFALPAVDDHPDYPLALAMAAVSAGFRGELDSAESLAAQALDAKGRLATHPDGRVDATVLRVRSMLAMAVGAWRDGAGYAEQAAYIDRSAGRAAVAFRGLCGAAQGYGFAGDADAAIPVATEALALAREIAMPKFVAQALSALANALAERDPQGARAVLGESLDLVAAQSEDTLLLTQVTFVAARLGDAHTALGLAARAIPRLHWNGEQPMLAGVVNVVAWASVDSDPEKAAVLQGAARRLAMAAMTQGAGATRPKPVGESPRPQGLIGDLRREATGRLAALLGDERLRELRTRGEAMDPAEAVQWALALSNAP